MGISAVYQDGGNVHSEEKRPRQLPPPEKNTSFGFMNLASFLLIAICGKSWILLIRKKDPMQLLFYSNEVDENKKRLEAAVYKAVPESRIEFFIELDDFGERLRRPVEPDSIAVLSVSNREELRRMQRLRGLLTEIFVVLVLPDRNKGTVELAHLLLPRFLSQKNDDFRDLGKVLNKMYRTPH